MPAAATPPAVHAVRQTGAGELASASATYALGALTYVGPSRGRGVLDLELGRGRVLMSGRDADQVSPTRWRLKIDTLRLVDQRRVTASCQLEFTRGGGGYAGLTCRGLIQPDGEPFAVRWRGDGTPSRRLDLPADAP